MSLISILVLLLQLVSSQSDVSSLEHIRAKITVNPVTALTAVQFAGRYANPSKELIKRIGPVLDGNNLYIFPDNTYVYCAWADIMPNTVLDKGTWNFSDSVLELKSAADITWDPNLERRFLAVRRPSHPKEILLVGIQKDIPNFAEEAGKDPWFALLMFARNRDSKLSQTETKALKARIMRESWRPDFMRKAP
jgi:hypothetical protein